MKAKFLIIRATILLSISSIVIINRTYCQEIYLNKTTKRNVIYLGAYNYKNQLRVYDKNRIVYINKNNLEQINQLSAKNFLDTLSKYKLSFLCGGTEPFWNASLTKNKFTFRLSTKTIYNIDISCRDDNVFIIMFKSKDNTIYGIIQGTIGRCNAAVTEEYSTFECTIYVKGEIYTGCGLVDKDNQM